MEVLATGEIFLFEGFRLDRRGLCRRDERGVFVPVVIGSRALGVLGVLIEGDGDLVLKDEIMAVVWPGTVVEDNNLTVQISALRRILDHGQPEASCIQTVAGRGYRFAATVTREAMEAASGTAAVSSGGGCPMPHPSIAAKRGFRSIAEVREEGAAPAPSKPSTIPARRRLEAWIHSWAALALLALVCATVATTAVIVQWGRPGAPNSGGGTAIVVMPFRNQGDGTAQAQIGEAVAERMAVELARLPATRIVGQNSAAAYADRSTVAPALPRIARSLRRRRQHHRS
jgi:DNA-binding winged helix-turn-helix (wHTH) protein